MSCTRLLFTLILSLTLLQRVRSQQTMEVNISASVTTDCALLVIPVALNSMSVRLTNHLDVDFIDQQEPASIGLNISNQFPLPGSSFSGSLQFQAQFSYDLCECSGYGDGGCPNLSGSFVDTIIPINFNGTCLMNNTVYSHNGANFTLSYSFRLVMTEPVVTPVSATCNTDAVNLQVNNTAPSYTWQVLNQAGTWVTFRNNASNAISATREELQTAAGNGAYANRNVRVVESGCLTNRSGPSSPVFNFHVPAPSFDLAEKDQTCHNVINGEVNIAITSALSPNVNDFVVSLYDDPDDPPIVQDTLNNLSNHNIYSLGTSAGSSKSYSVTVTNNTNIKLYGSCTAEAEPVIIYNPSAIETTFTRVLKNGYDISCHGGSNGEVTAVPNGGKVGYHSFSWQKAGVDQNIASDHITNRDAGNYSVSYLDGNGCESLPANIWLTQPPILSVSIESNNLDDYNGFDISCPGATDGSITAIGDGGAGGRNYQWAGGHGAATYTGLGTGNYAVTVTDGNGCTANSNIELTAPPQIIFSLTVGSITCPGLSTGSLTVSDVKNAIEGITAYAWSNSANSNAIQNLSAGTYHVTITDEQGCTANREQTLIDPLPYSLSIAPQSDYNGNFISCSSAADGVLGASLLDADGVQSTGDFTWYKGQSVVGIGSAAYNLNEGTYRVEVIYGEDCEIEQSYFLEAPEPYTVNITPQSNYDGNVISCSTASDGILSATLLNENSLPVIGTFTWYRGETMVGEGATAYNLSEGNYSVDAVYGNGCIAGGAYFLEAPEPYTVNITPQSNYDGNVISCSTASDGILSATLLNENSLLAVGTFTWYKGEAIVGEGATASNLNEGNYNVDAEYGNGCIAEGTYFLEAPEPFVAAISIQSNYNGSAISCHEAQDGALAVTLYDEEANIAEVEFYTWSRNGEVITTGEALANITNLNQGDYNVVTTYMGVCTATANISLSAPNPVIVDVQADSDYNGYITSCVGENNGSLLAIASGGTPGAYSYVWDTGSESASLTNIGAGDYSVTATDINNCPVFSNFTVEDPPVLTAFIQTTSDFFGFPISCTGQSDASLLATATGGTNEYTFLWSTGLDTETLTNIPSGNYIVTATDENGCTAEANISIVDPPAVAVSISILSDYNGQAITCAGEANGRLGAIATGGTNIFSYAWNIGTLGSIQNNLPAGTYAVVATDQNGCQAQAQQELVEPTPVVASVVNISDYNGFGVSCAAGLNGFIEVEGSGGTGTFDYTWSDHTETSELLSGIGAGMYSVTISDSNGCSDEVSQQITEPTVLVLSVLNKNDLACFGGNNGSINIQANGGVQAYSYAINLSEQTSESLFSALTAGDYTFHVYDANNCYATVSEILVQPSQIEINFEDVEPAFCDDARGSASANVTGGVMNYTYQWRNSVNEVFDEDNTVNNLAAGLYSLLITDGNNCEASKFLGIQATDGPMVVVDEIIPAKCSYSADGSISMQVIEGDGPYTFQWQDGQSSATAQNLAQGEYFVVVQDVNNCTTVSLAIVNAPPSLAISLIELRPPSCYGYSDGSIEVLGSGGTAPYAYDWGIFQGALFPGRSKGNTYLTLYDANQCMTQASYAIPEPTPLSVNLISRVLPTCYGECNGQLEVRASGGNGAYVYHWDSGGQLALANDLCASNHVVSILDAKGCTLQASYALGQPSQLTPRLLVLDSPDCFDGCDGELAVDAIGGVGDYTYVWSSGHEEANPQNLCAGSYTVSIQDENGCEAQQTHNLINPAQLSIELGESRTICEGQSHTLSIDGIWSTYQWTSNVNFQSEAPEVVLTLAGQYWLTLTNALGCIARDTFLLSTSNDLLGASFIMPAEANVQDTIVLIDITWPMAESISWQLPSDFILIEDQDEVIHGKFSKAGVHTIGMHALLGECHDEVTKSISILGETSDGQRELLGYEEFVKVFDVFPNPTQGRFTISLQFAEETFATLSIWEVLTGKIVKQMELEEGDDFLVSVDLLPLPPGAYILRMDYRGGIRYLRFVVD